MSIERYSCGRSQQAIGKINTCRIMKRIILIFVALCFIALEAEAQVGSGRPAVTTQLSDVRYEFVQAPTDSSQSLLVDKFAGRVWKYKGKRRGFVEIIREDADAVDTTIVNYQIYMSATDSRICFLLNVHTGQMWRYGEGDEGGKAFKRMEMPFLTPQEE